MEESILNANRVLTCAAQHDRNASLCKILNQAKGVALITEPEKSEIVVSGPVGNGIVLVQDETTREWSDPFACNLGGTGWGCIGGASKQIIVVILDQQSLDSLTSPTGLELNEGASLAVGTFDAVDSGPFGSHFVSKSDTGRVSDTTRSNEESRGPGTLSIAFTKGAYVSASANGASIYPSQGPSEEFYGKKVTAKEFLVAKKRYLHRDHKMYSEVQGIYKKLKLLGQGKNAELDPTNDLKHVPREAPAAIQEVVNDAISIF